MSTIAQELSHYFPHLKLDTDFVECGIYGGTLEFLHDLRPGGHDSENNNMNMRYIGRTTSVYSNISNLMPPVVGTYMNLEQRIPIL